MADENSGWIWGLVLIGGFWWWTSSDDKAEQMADRYGIPEEEASEYLDSVAGDLDDAIDEYTDETFDEDAAREAAEAELALEGYDKRYGCTDECDGHEAGWQWRAENGYLVTDPSTYGNSYSFGEGAMAFEEAVEERVEEMRDEYADGEEIY